MARTWMMMIIIVSWCQVSDSTEVGRLLTANNCVCIGYNTTYRCTAIGNGATRWGGTAFNCPHSGNKISLIHERYGLPDGTTKYCNGGAIIGLSMQVDGNHYTSLLLVDVTVELNGTTVKCEHDDLSSRIAFIGHALIILTAEPFSPPDDIYLVAITPYSLTFQWSAVANSCASLLYEINTDCGICVDATYLTNVSCSTINIREPKVSQCSFRVRSIVCGNIAGIWSNPVNVTMKVPEPVIIIAIEAIYTSDRSLTALMIEFRGSDWDMFNISRGIEGYVHNYSIVYADAVTMHACHSVITTNLTSSAPRSCFSSNSNISVSLSAINLFGEGPKTNITIAAKADYYLRLVTSAERITCQLLDKQKLFSTKLCNVSYGECSNKEKWTAKWSYTSTESPFTVDLALNTDLQYCYEVSATIDNFTVIITGNHSSSSNSGELPHHVVVICATIGSVLIITIPITAILIVACWLRKRHSIHAHVVFELMDHPRELRKVLIILKEKAINIVETKIGELCIKKCTRKIYMRFEEDLTDDIETEIKRRIKEIMPPDSDEIETYQSAEVIKIDEQVTDYSVDGGTGVINNSSSNTSSASTDDATKEHCYLRRLPSRSGALLSLLEGIWNLPICNDSCCDINITGIAEVPITVCNKWFCHFIKIKFSVRGHGQFPKTWKNAFDTVKIEV